MRRRNKEMPGREGRLPSMAPLANPYVPFQVEQPPMYEAGKAIVRGTLYPGLDLPWMDSVNNTPLPKNPKTDLQILAFLIQELALYLDTHRDDQKALEKYQQYQQMYRDCMEEYTKSHGQLNHRAPTQGKNFRWLDDPWPWEFAANKEV